MWEYITAFIKADVEVGDKPSFDPLYGFKNGRKERVMIATKEEMEASKMPLALRDYCAHRVLEYWQCARDVWPFPYKCHHAGHAIEQCRYEDFILRSKEFERERRLLLRQKRKEAMQY